MGHSIIKLQNLTKKNNNKWYNSRIMARFKHTDTSQCKCLWSLTPLRQGLLPIDSNDK